MLGFTWATRLIWCSCKPMRPSRPLSKLHANHCLHQTRSCCTICLLVCEALLGEDDVHAVAVQEQHTVREAITVDLQIEGVGTCEERCSAGVSVACMLLLHHGDGRHSGTCLSSRWIVLGRVSNPNMYVLYCIVPAAVPQHRAAATA
jgi:hypothetical protein